MRYLIETKPEFAMKIGATIANWAKKNEIDLIEKGDPVDEIRKDVLKISKAFETLRKAGINKEILIAYIRTKGVSLATINQVLDYQDEFFEKLGVKKR